MKKIKRIFAFALILGIFATTLLSVNAEGILNTYNGVEYSTNDELKELESLLKKDGYVLIDKSYYDDLEQKDYFWYAYIQNSSVYVSNKAWNEYLDNGSVETMKDETVIVDNYSNETCDSNVLSDHFGSNLEETEDWGTIIVKGNMDTDILQSSNHPQAFVTLNNVTLNERYQFTLDYYNNYTISVNCPVGQYVVSSAYIDEKYPAVVENEEVMVYGEGQELTNMGSITFNVTYGDTVSKEQFNSGVCHNEKPEEEVKEPSKTPYKIVLILILIVGGILLVYGIYKIKKIIDNNRCE